MFVNVLCVCVSQALWWTFYIRHLNSQNNTLLKVTCSDKLTLRLKTGHFLIARENTKCALKTDLCREQITKLIKHWCHLNWEKLGRFAIKGKWLYDTSKPWINTPLSYKILYALRRASCQPLNLEEKRKALLIIHLPKTYWIPAHCSALYIIITNMCWVYCASDTARRLHASSNLVNEQTCKLGIIFILTLYMK